MSTIRYGLALVGIVAFMLAGCSTEPPTQSDRASLDTDVQQAMQRMNATDPGLSDFLSHAYGYAVFPTAGKGGIGIGGAYGHGELYDHGTFVGYADISQGTIGAQLGGESFTELVVFENKEAMDSFKSGTFTFSANATATAMKSGAAASQKYDSGVAVFVQPLGGLMLEASIGGQSFSYQPKS
jgi:lipid-binding SYLF domain-containing protein